MHIELCCPHRCWLTNGAGEGERDSIYFCVTLGSLALLLLLLGKVVLHLQAEDLLVLGSRIRPTC
jgi:hypothetical protein